MNIMIKCITSVPNGTPLVSFEKLGVANLIEAVENLQFDISQAQHDYGPEATAWIEIDGHDVSWLEQHFAWSPGTKREKAEAFIKIVQSGQLAEICELFRRGEAIKSEQAASKTAQFAMVNADSGTVFGVGDTVDAAREEIDSAVVTPLKWREITRREFDSLDPSMEGGRYQAVVMRGEELTDETVGYWLAVEAA